LLKFPILPTIYIYLFLQCIFLIDGICILSLKILSIVLFQKLFQTPEITLLLYSIRLLQVSFFICFRYYPAIGVGILLGLYFEAISAINLICSGVVPQQPPIILIIFSSKYAFTNACISLAVWSYSPKALGKPAFGCAEI